MYTVRVIDLLIYGTAPLHACNLPPQIRCYVEIQPEGNYLSIT